MKIIQTKSKKIKSDFGIEIENCKISSKTFFVIICSDFVRILSDIKIIIHITYENKNI